MIIGHSTYQIVIPIVIVTLLSDLRLISTGTKFGKPVELRIMPAKAINFGLVIYNWALI